MAVRSSRPNRPSARANGVPVAGCARPANTSTAPVTIATTAAAIGLPADPHGYLVQDLWGSNSVVVGGQASFSLSSAGNLSAAVPAEGVALYRITPLP